MFGCSAVALVIRVISNSGATLVRKDSLQEDAAVNRDDLSLADDLEIAELAILQKLPNVDTHCVPHHKFRVGDESIGRRRVQAGRCINTWTNKKGN